jgi:hypothetical protein
MTDKILSKLALAIAFALVLVMPSAESIWVDEAQTWRYARHTSLNAAWNEFIKDPRSETQMPLAMALAWSFGNLLGTSEWMLRAPNILWASGALLCFYYLGRKEKQPFMPIFLATQPYLWFYVNEARPYALQIFGGSLLLLSLHNVFTKGSTGAGWILLWGAGALITCGSSMLGAIPVASVSLVIFVHLIKNRLPLGKKQILLLLIPFIPLFALGIYYSTTLLRGAGGAKIWQVGPQNLMFSVVEFIGLAGFLPPRQELRELARGAIPASLDAPFFWLNSLVIIVFLTLFLLLFLYTIKNWKTFPSWVIASTLIVVASAFLLFLAALFVGFPFWGRHLAACFPFYVVAVFAAITQVCKSRGGFIKYLPLLVAVSLLWSSLLLRFDPSHRKDDYRSAAKLAQSQLEQGKTVWWAADDPALLFYLPNAEIYLSSQTLFLAYGERRTPIELRKKPNLILLSKPDIYDSSQEIAEYLVKHNYRGASSLKAFSVHIADGSD